MRARKGVFLAFLEVDSLCINLYKFRILDFSKLKRFANAMKQATTLVVCVLGLYGSFLSWSVLQERINTKPYGNNPSTGRPDFYKSPLIINTLQALFASLIGFIYSLISSKSSPFAIFTKNDRAHSKVYLRSLFILSLTLSISSPIAYQLLKHVDYLAFLLAKSCKLIPVILVHLVLYQTRFPFYKYVVAAAVTLGVMVFTFAHSLQPDKVSMNDGQTFIGLLQLVASMVLDGLTNSSQDQLFKWANDAKPKVKLSAASLMCILNGFIFLNTLAYTVLFRFDNEISYTYNFAKHYPLVLVHIVQFGLLGAVGQVFIFLILERFDSLILITATVTRKMISMILSVVLFGHILTRTQWAGVLLVFLGIGYEAWMNSMSKQKKSTTEKKNQ